MALPKIILLEDSSDDSILITRRLIDVATVHVARNRADFERLLAAHSFDVILLDFSVPQFGGEAAIEVAEKMHPWAPIVLVTGSVSRETCRATCRKNVIDFLIKDIEYERLDVAVRNAYERVLKEQENEKLRLRNLQNQRHEILGEFSAKLSHDVNNSLASIMMGIGMLRDPKARIEDRERILDSMEHASNKCASMVKQMMTFAKGANGSAFKLISAERLLGEVQQMMQYLINGSRIRLSVRTDVGTSDIKCNPTQINTMLVNMAINSKAAMKTGGELFLEARNVVMHEPGLEGKYICVTVRDTGEGILPENIDAIFEPYWTTKGTGGTGLGLAMVKPIMEAHNGAVRVRSDPTGTMFSLYFPVSIAEPQEPEEIFNGNGAVIILVDDEEIFRDMVRRSLEDVNYKVLSACNGPEALSFFRSNPRVDLLVSDVGLPIMDGLELLRHLRGQGFDVPTIFITGREFEMPFDPEPAAVLQKPVTRVDLLRKIRDVLTAATNSSTLPV